MSQVPSSRLRFGAFEVDVAAGELRRSGIRVRLGPQPFRVLVLLLRHPGEIVERRTLRQELWGNRAHGDFDHAFAFCMHRLRVALRDDARAPRFIETVPGRGYRFLAPVEAVSAEAPAPASARAPRAWRLMATVAAGAFVVAGLTFLFPRESDVARPPALPNVSADARLEHAHGQLQLSRAGRLAPHGAYRVAREEALAALAVGPRADAHLVLAAVALNDDWDGAAALREVERAEAVEPDSSCVAIARVRTLSLLGRHQQALLALERAERAHPSSEGLVLEGVQARYRAHRFEAARQGLARDQSLGGRGASERWREFMDFKTSRQLGDLERAGRVAAAFVRRSGASPAQVAAFDALPPDRRVPVFLQGTLRYLRHAPPEETSPAQVALPNAALGLADAALALLERAAIERSPLLLEALADPDLDGLRAHPRFQRLLAAIGFAAVEPPPTLLAAPGRFRG